MRLPATLLLVALGSTALARPHKTTRRPAAGPDSALARQIVSAAQVGGQDVVLVRAGHQTLSLAEEVATQAAEKGAATTIDFVSPDAVRAWIQAAPESALAQAPPCGQSVLQTSTVVIDLASPFDPGLLSGIAPGRLDHLRDGRKALDDTFWRSNVRRLEVAGAAYPSEESARLFHAEPAAFQRAMWAAAEVKTPLIQFKTDRVRKALAGLKQIRVTAPNGTDLSLRLSGGPLYVNNGFFDPDTLARPGAHEISLPAGEVAAAPHTLFGTGELVGDTVIDGTLVKGVHLRFTDGKALPESGGAGYDLFQRAFDDASGSKGIIGVFAVGTNDASRPPRGSTYRSSEMAGMVTIGIGYDKRVGGSNDDTSFAASFLLPDATVTVNGTPLVQHGKLVP